MESTIFQLKGRLKKFPVIIALLTSIAVQGIIFISNFLSYPDNFYPSYGKYCKLKDSIPANLKSGYCPENQIDIQLWWQDHYEYMFLTLSVIFIFTLLVAGTYLIINDLSQEERKGTLNFIRLSPQSETSIFTGKMLGVPVLIYLMVLAAIPFHILTGKLANIASSYILCFYLILVTSCIFFYSIASLLGIFGNSVFSNFKPWLGSGLVLVFLWITMPLYGSFYHHYIGFLKLFSPTDITHYLFPNLYRSNPALEDLEFFDFALGQNVFSLVAIYLLNYALWTYWAWQGLKRCFRNPNATIFSKQQSYLIVVSFQIMILGFVVSEDYTQWWSFNDATKALYIWNLFLIVLLFPIILPHRQAVQDWAIFRYHRDGNSADNSQKSLLSDLIFGEKSPAILAIAINLLIAASSFVVLFLKENVYLQGSDKILGFLSILLVFISLILIYATIAQIMLMLKNSKRILWAMGTTSAAIIILPILSLQISNTDYLSNFLWLFTIGFWFAAENSVFPMILSANISQLMILGLLNRHLIRQVKSAGESATKALFYQSKV